MRLLKTSDSIIDISSNGYSTLIGYKKNGEWTIRTYARTKQFAEELVAFINGDKAKVILYWNSSKIAKNIFGSNDNITVEELEDGYISWQARQDIIAQEYSDYKVTETFVG